MPPLTLNDPEDCRKPPHPRAIEGMELFNSGQYWKAHEALEAAWRAESGPIRDLYKGILQAGVVYLHVSHANFPGAIKVNQRCRRWLDPWPDRCRGIEVGTLRKDLAAVMEQVLALGPERLDQFDRSLLKPVIYQNVMSNANNTHGG